MKRARMNALVALGVIAACVLLIYLKGFRYPPPQFIPERAPTGFDTGKGLSIQGNGTIFQRRDGSRYKFRAFVPEPVITVEIPDGAEWHLEIGNIHPRATLMADGTEVTEQQQDLRRVVSGGAGNTRLEWVFPKREQYRFAAIGDTGGGAELRWVLHRAQKLKADFVLHLGDLYYGPGEYLAAAAAFADAGIPTYVAIGNHDFNHQLSSVHHLFRQHIGPRNATFRLGRIQFVNVDTAAAFVPAGTGVRGEFFRGLERIEGIDDIVVFTHMPLIDPDQERAHSAPRREHEYLHEQLKRLGAKTLLAGHIHIKEEFADGDVRTIVSGQGLAHADLIVDHPSAEILLGDVSPDRERVVYSWAPIDMPLEAHCNPRAWEVVTVLNKTALLQQLQEACAGN